MTTSVRETVLAAVATKLAGVSGATVYRNRGKEIAESALPALNLVDGGATVVETGHAFALYTMSATVEGYCKAATAALLGPAINDLHAKTLAAVMADRTLGNIAIDIREGDLGVEIDRTDGASPNGAFSLLLEIDYATIPGDPYTLAPS